MPPPPPAGPLARSQAPAGNRARAPVHGAVDVQCPRHHAGIFAFDDCADIVAVNRAARFLFADFDAMPARDRNMTAWMLTDPRARSLYGPAWEEVATTMTGALRRTAGRQPGNPRVTELVRRLSDDSALFRNAWRRHDIGTCTRMINRLHHPAGTLEFVSDIVTADSDKGIMFALLIPLDPTVGSLLSSTTIPALNQTNA